MKFPVESAFINAETLGVNLHEISVRFGDREESDTDHNSGFVNNRN